MRFFTLIVLVFPVFLLAQTVYCTPSETKYHLAGCRMVKNVSSAKSVERALKEGFSPCSICRPPVKAVVGRSTVKKVAGVNSANRCGAPTKSGTRCKRNTRIGNNFCFQHLPK